MLSKLRIKSSLAEMTKRLPWGGRRAILEALVEDFGRFEVFQELGRQLRVESLGVRGANGTICGSIDDLYLLGRYAESGSWSTEAITLLQDFFHQRGGGTYLDIGANIGLTLVPISQNPQVQCFGFEPEPRNFAFLQRNVEANCPYRNVDIKQLALFEKETELQFELSAINSGDHRIRVSNDEGMYQEATRKTISVKANRLDNVLQLGDANLPIAVKMDTQGAEPAIFAGGPRILSAAELLILEFWPYGIRRMGGNAKFELKFLMNHFREGSVVPGDVDSAIEWRPVTSVVAELEAHWENHDIGVRYFEVCARK